MLKPMDNVSAGLQRDTCLVFSAIHNIISCYDRTHQAIGIQKSLPSFLHREITSALSHFNSTGVKITKVILRIWGHEYPISISQPGSFLQAPRCLEWWSWAPCALLDQSYCDEVPANTRRKWRREKVPSTKTSLQEHVQEKKKKRMRRRANGELKVYSRGDGRDLRVAGGKKKMLNWPSRLTVRLWCGWMLKMAVWLFSLLSNLLNKKCRQWKKVLLLLQGCDELTLNIKIIQMLYVCKCLPLDALS